MRTASSGHWQGLVLHWNSWPINLVLGFDMACLKDRIESGVKLSFNLLQEMEIAMDMDYISSRTKDSIVKEI